VENPWHQLPSHPLYVLSEDREILETFNYHARPEHQIHLELLPEPFIGDPTAPIILLNLNPGFSDQDILYHQGNVAFAEANRATLTQSRQEYPFYLLDPRFHDASGSRWWQSKLRSLIERFGYSAVAREICVIEFFPYHSAKFHFNGQVPSQQFSFDLVSQALKRDAIAIQMRSKRQWIEAVPALEDYQHYYTLNNPQNVAISARNCPVGYQAILDRFEAENLKVVQRSTT